MGLYLSCNNHASRENDICILTKCMVKALGPRINYKKKQKSRKKRWFDNECKMMRKELRKLGRQLFVNPDNHDIRNNHFRKKKMFQKMVKHKKREIKQMIIDKLELLEENDPQRYWNLVDQLKNSENDSQINSVLTLDQWTNHYKELLVNPNHQNLNSTIYSRIMKLKSQQIFNELSAGVKVSEVLMAVKSLKRWKNGQHRKALSYLEQVVTGYGLRLAGIRPRKLIVKIEFVLNVMRRDILTWMMKCISLGL